VSKALTLDVDMVYAAGMQQSVVYFVKIGKHIKIGFTTKLKQRLKTFETSSVDVELLLAIPGDRPLERTLHEKLADSRATRELFHRDGSISTFISIYGYAGLTAALQYLDDTTPAALARRRTEEREKRVAVARQSRAEKDAYFASLVADRKKRMGR
jgi:hypothetical protein